MAFLAAAPSAQYVPAVGDASQPAPLVFPQRLASEADHGGAPSVARRTTAGWALDLGDRVPGFSAYLLAETAPDGTAYAAGLTAPSDESASLSVVLARLGADGSPDWTAEITSAGSPALLGSLAADDAGACVLLQRSARLPDDALGPASTWGAYIYRVDASGEVAWSAPYEGWFERAGDGLYGASVHLLAPGDGGCQIVAPTRPPGGGFEEGLIFRFDASGQEAERFSLEGLPRAAIYTGDALVLSTSAAEDDRVLTFALAADGSVLWEAPEIFATHLFALDDGGVLAVRGGFSGFPTIASRLAADGSITWSRVATPGLAIDAAADGGFVIAGFVQGTGAKVESYAPDGSLRWSYLGGPEDDRPLFVQALPGGDALYAYDVEVETETGTVLHGRQERLSDGARVWLTSSAGAGGEMSLTLDLVQNVGGAFVVGAQATDHVHAFAQAIGLDGQSAPASILPTPAAPDTELVDVVEDGAGGIYVAGRTGDQGYVARVSSAGEVLWEDQISIASMEGDHDVRAYALTADAFGVYVAALDTPPAEGEEAAYPDILALAYTPDGDERWRATYGAADLLDFPSDIVPDGLGGAYVTGISWTTRPAQVGAFLEADALVVAYDETGAFRWEAREVGEGDWDYEARAAVALPPADDADRAGVAVFSRRSSERGLGAQVSARAYEADGSLRWSQQDAEGTYRAPVAASLAGDHVRVAVNAIPIGFPPSRSGIASYNVDTGAVTTLNIAGEPSGPTISPLALAANTDGLAVMVGSDVAFGSDAPGSIRYQTDLLAIPSLSLAASDVALDDAGFAFVAGLAVAALDAEGSIRQVRRAFVPGVRAFPSTDYPFYLYFPFRFDPYQQTSMALARDESPAVAANRAHTVYLPGMGNTRIPAYASAELRLVDRALLTSAEDLPGETVAVHRLGHAAPNPSRAAQRLPLTLAMPAPARVVLLDLLGREIAVLHDAYLPTGRTDLALPERLAPGLYVVRAEVGSGAERQVLTRRIVRL